MTPDLIIRTGLTYLGKPYKFNAPSFQTDFFDCSSFIQYIFSVNGIPLPRNSRQQYQIGLKIPFHKKKKGDLLFFTTTSRKKKKGFQKIGHVALYVGDNKMLHTFRQGGEVQITSINAYWRSVYVGTKRVL